MNVQTSEHFQLLVNGGLSQLEGKIYVLLLERRELNGNQIAETLSVERSLVYRSLKRLLEKNLISSSNESYNCRYFIESTETLIKFSDKKVKKATNELSAIKDFVSKIPMLSLEGVLKSKVRVFRGENSITKVYGERNVSRDKLIREISTDTIFPGIENKWWDEQIRLRKSNGSFLHQLVDNADTSTLYHRTNKKQFKEVRLVSDDLDINAGINVYQNKVVFHNSSVENPMALVIEDEDVSKLMKNLFDFIWNRSKVI